MLELRGVTYRYPGETEPAIGSLDFAVGDGEVVGIVGANGAGKSTLCLLASGLAPASVGGTLGGGQLTIDGRKVTGLGSGALAGLVAIGLQDPWSQRSGIATSVVEEVALGPVSLGLEVGETLARTREALRVLQIEELADRDPRTLSGGETALVILASLVALRPRHLVLDEPIAQLDPAASRRVGEALARIASSGTSIVVAEHRTELLARICSRIVVLAGGRIVADGAPEELQADPRLPGWGVAPPGGVDPAPTTAGSGAGDEAEGGSPRIDGPLPARTRPPRVVLDGVTVRYAGAAVPALDGVDLAIEPGSRVAIVGANGSGKTTLLRLLDGLLRPTSGRVLHDALDIAPVRVARLAATVGLAFQDPSRQIQGATVRAEVASGARNLGFRGEILTATVSGSIGAVGLAGLETVHPYDLGPAVRKLVTIAGVIAMRTPVVALDEPTTGQDPAGLRVVGSVVEALRDAGRTVIAVTHDLDFALGRFDRVVALAGGRVVLDRAAREISRSQLEAITDGRTAGAH